MLSMDRRKGLEEGGRNMTPVDKGKKMKKNVRWQHEGIKKKTEEN